MPFSEQRKEKTMSMESHWRNTMKPVRFFAFDAKAAIPFGLFIVHARLWTLLLTILVLVGFWLLERRGLSLPAALRAFRLWLFAGRRPAFLWTRRRGMVDTGSI